MLTKVGPPEILEKLFENLKEIGEVVGPVKTGNRVKFLPISSLEEAHLGYRRTILPPRKLFIRPKEDLLKVSDCGAIEEIPPEQSPMVLFGLHPCDIKGLEILSTFMRNGYPDPYYLARREQTFIVGISCTPDDKCFCRSMGCSNVDKGFDIFITLLGNFVMIRSGSPAGYRFIRKLDGKLHDPGPVEKKAFLEFTKARNESFTLSLDITDLPEILELEEENEIWEMLGNRCFTCGNCSMVCPTCSCFQVYDVPSLTEEWSTRVRQWDSCLFKSYALVAGGHNFREKRSQRVKNRYYHKQKGFVEAFGMPSCVGCGRCISSCPAGIDIVNVFSTLKEAYR